ncbi:FadR family transcriptional regulator [Arthrobacter sp. E918]|uniref:FadR family transcriptional regulator n=1 Tax=Arthrobacter mobilis TaxID=2724944 RepID=A0A7X6HF27_9MICC|nr:FadR family transcriptional regulator [Arthrobacter mobilis]
MHQVRVAESVASELRARILRGEFSSGMLPKQEDLRDEYGISHPSLREALRILETEGLVTVRRGNVGGASVHRPGEGRFGYSLGIALQSAGTRIDELAASLARLEPLCARLCAENPNRGTEVVPKLRKVLAQAPHDDEGVSFTRSSRDFHAAVVDLCGDSPIQLIVGGLVRLWTAQEEAWAETLSLEGEYPGHEARAHATKAHARLVDLIDAGNADEAEAYSRKHIVATQQLVIAKVDGRVVDASSTRARRHLLSA